MLCWFTRWRLSTALDRAPGGAPSPRGHLARCAACQAYAARLTTLHAQLTAGAAGAARPPSPAPRRARRSWLVAGPLMLAGAAAVAVLGFGLGDGPLRPTPARPPITPAVAVDLRGVADRLVTVVRTARTPLEAELDNLLHDGRRGVDAVLAVGGLRRPDSGPAARPTE